MSGFMKTVLSNEHLTPIKVDFPKSGLFFMCLLTAHCGCRNKWIFLSLTIAILSLIFLFLQVIFSARYYFGNLPGKKQTKTENIAIEKQ